MRSRRTTGRIVALTLSVFAAPVACAPAHRAEVGPSGDTWDLPPLRFGTLAGEARRLHDWRGKVILLNFWATWCGPCQAEVPHLIRYQNQYGDQGLQVVGVALDDPRKVRNFARTLRINYPIMLADPAREGVLLPQWGNASRGLPFTVVIGRDGHVHYRLNGILDEETFADCVQPLLEEESQPWTPS